MIQTLEITVIGQKYIHPIGFKEVKMVRTEKITGSRLSIRKAESKAVSDFFAEHKLGSCGLSSKIIKA
jgi:hypothetical protein